MNLFKNISDTLAKHLTWNKARLFTMTTLVKGIIHTRNVNLVRIADCDDIENGNSATKESKYRRFQRFFSDFEMPLEDVSNLIGRKIPKPTDGYVLSMDRTNWQFGKKHINILVVGINIGKVCVPFVWKVLPQSSKNGNSNHITRQKSFDRHK